MTVTLHPQRLAASIGAVTAGIVLAGCGGAESDAEGEPTQATVVESATVETSPAETAPAETATTETQPKPAPAPKPAATTVKIVVRDGRAVGGIVRERLSKGERVVLVITSDIADHVHLHGYDVMVDVAPGKAARLTFTATIPGRFEVELEDRGVQIADLEVRP